MSPRNARIRAWLRTAEGKLVLFTLILAGVTALVSGLESVMDWERKSREAEVLQQISTPRAKMLKDLHAGIRHDAFLKKYGKPATVSRRSDGLLWLHYEGLSVTFSRAGTLLEVRGGPTTNE